MFICAGIFAFIGCAYVVLISYLYSETLVMALNANNDVHLSRVLPGSRPMSECLPLKNVASVDIML
jgi:hypothetical protein